MPYKGATRDMTFPYVLRSMRDLPEDEQTVYNLRMTGVVEGNKNVAAYSGAMTRNNEDAVARRHTKNDLNHWLRNVASIENFEFAEDDEPTSIIETEEGLRKAFYQHFYADIQEILNACERESTLRSSERKKSSSSSGRRSQEKSQAESASTAGAVKKPTEKAEDFAS